MTHVSTIGSRFGGCYKPRKDYTYRDGLENKANQYEALAWELQRRYQEQVSGDVDWQLTSEEIRTMHQRAAWARYRLAAHLHDKVPELAAKLRAIVAKQDGLMPDQYLGKPTCPDPGEIELALGWEQTFAQVMATREPRLGWRRLDERRHQALAQGEPAEDRVREALRRLESEGSHG